MKIFSTLVRGFFLLCLLGALSTSLPAQHTDHLSHGHPSDTAPPAGVSIQNTLPVRFTPNLGQVADADGKPRPEILYTAESGGVRLFLSANRLSYVFKQITGMEFFKHDDMYEEGDPQPMLNLYRMDMELIGANPSPQVLSEQEVTEAGYTNYYFAHCPDGINGVKSYSRLVYREIYPKIDMVLYGTAEGTKCDFIVAPGGDPSDIRIRYIGGEQPELTAEGVLRVANPLGAVEEEAPYSYQSMAGISLPPMLWKGIGETREIASRYRIDGGIVSFELGSYDRTRPLVIDPARKWVTFYGGSGAEQMLGGDASEVDRSGNPLIAGYTNAGGTTFPTSPGAFQITLSGADDLFIVKMTNSGIREWATLYGGTASELSHGIVSDVYRNVFVAGHTYSNNFPVANAYQGTHGNDRDAFCIKFDSNGVRQWATFYGGNDFEDSYGFAIDSTGNPAMLGTTSSTNTIATSESDQSSYGGGQYDAFIVKFSSDGDRQWGTYFGGSSREHGWAAAADSNDNIIVTGWTNSLDLPTLNAHQPTNAGGDDAFVAKYDPTGTRLWSTYFGGSGTENDIGSIRTASAATDGEGNAIIVGLTNSFDFPATTGAVQRMPGGATDAFIVKFDTIGTRQWATFFGGTGTDVAQGVASNNGGGVLVTGYTNSVNFPNISPRAFQSTLAGNTDAFIIKLTGDGTTASFVTYYGGTAADQGIGISFDPYGSIIFTGLTSSANFPVVAPYQTTYGGSQDAFIGIFCDIEHDVIDTSGPLTFCHGDSVTLSVPVGYMRYHWYPGGERTNAITVRRPAPDNIGYRVKVVNGAGCEAISDTLRVSFHSDPDPVITPLNPDTLCMGDSIQLDALPVSRQNPLRPYATYEWWDGDLTTHYPQWDNLRRPWIKTNGSYRVIVRDVTGCLDTSSAWTYKFVRSPDPIWITGDLPGDTVVLCEGDRLTIMANRLPATDELFYWTGPATGTGSDQGRVAKMPGGTYYLTAVTSGRCTTRTNPIHVKYNPRPAPPIYASRNIFCDGDSVKLQAPRGYRRYMWNDNPAQNTTFIWFKAGGTVTLEVTDTNGCVGRSTYNLTKVEDPQPEIRIRQGDTALCEGDSVVLDVGSGWASTQWSNGEQIPRITVREGGRYTVKVADPIGKCVGYDTINVVVKPRPLAILNGPIAVCPGSLSTYTVTKTTGVTYEWTVSGAGGTITSGSATDGIVVRWGTTAANGTVRVRVRFDSSSCFRDSSLTVKVDSSLTPSITENRSTTLCAGDTAGVTLDAGGGYTRYTWRNRVGNVVGNARTYTARDSGAYTVDVADASGCSGSSAPKVIRRADPPLPTITTVGGDTLLCPGESLTLDGGNFTSWRWSPGGQTSRTISVSNSGSFAVTVTDANGCSATSPPMQIAVAASPKPVVSGPNSVCINAAEMYSAVDVSGNSYSWSLTGGVGTIIAGGATSSVTVQWASNGTGTLVVTETSASTGCTGSSDLLFVMVGSTIQPDITPAVPLLCAGGSVVLHASSGYDSYAWSDAAGSPLGISDSLVVTATGDYTLSIVDGACSGSTTISVKTKPPIVPVVTPNVGGICQGDSLLLQTPAGYASYRWNRGDTTQSIWVNAGGNYMVTVSDADGCHGSSAIAQIVSYPQPAAVITIEGETLTANKGSSYQWNLDGSPITGATAQRYVPGSYGSFAVTLTDTNGCTAVSPAIAVRDTSLPSIAEATVGIGHHSASPGDHVTIPVELTGARNLEPHGIKSFSARLRFNRSLLIPVDRSLPTTTEGGNLILTISGTLPAAVSGSQPLVHVEFIAALGNAISTPVVIDSFFFNESRAEITTIDGLFTLTGLCEDGGVRLIDASGSTVLKPARPNPTNGRTEIEYEVVEQGWTELFVVDLLGRITPLTSGVIQPGRYIITFDAAALASGTYFCVLQTPTERISTLMRVE